MTGSVTRPAEGPASSTDRRTELRRILVIKLGALGDVVQATGPFAAIRRHHAGAHITLLTTKPFADFLRESGYFDEVWVDPRRPLWDLGALSGLRRRMRAAHFDRVYDLQTSGRSSFYFRLIGPGVRPEWSGIAQGCSHPHRNPGRDAMHTIERQAEQLADAGIASTPLPDVSWVHTESHRSDMARPYVLFVPGGSLHRPEKRWPAERYAELARRLSERGMETVLLGTANEGPVMERIRRCAPAVHDLTGRTSFADIVGLARDAAGAVGNDTGPMHLIAAAGCPSTVLFSNASDPGLCAPRAAKSAQPVTILRRPSLADLGVDEVDAALQLRDP
ncbi:MAG: glycosyltransferase family 9 protein [Alphaproteobacteria bacterium]